MNERFLITTAIGLALCTGAFAQSPNEQSRTNSSPATQNQTNSNSAAPTSSSTPSSAPSAQNTQSTPSGTSKPSTTTSQSAPTNDAARSQAQSNQASPSTQAQPGTNATTPPSQAQSAQPSNPPAQAQTNTAPPANNQSQASPTGTTANTNGSSQPSNNTAAQPSNNQNVAQSPSSNVSVSANLNESQRTRVSESIARLKVAPLNNVNFSLSVGTAVPRDVRFQPLPADVVEVMPQYRGYNFVVVRDDIVIVDPSSYKIVDVLPRAGQSTAAAPAAHRTTFSDRDREVIRKHARSSRVEQRTTGSAASTRARVGERLSDSVEIRSFPEEVYRESPTLRDYRYIERDNRTYVVEPRERTIIEEIE